MTDPTPQITCFVQTNMVGMAYGDIVTLAHTPYVDALIAGGRLVPTGDPIYSALLAENAKQPATWDLLDTAHSAASPTRPVTPATVALNDTPVAVEPAPAPVVVEPTPFVVEPPVAPAPAPVETPVAPVAPAVDPATGTAVVADPVV